MANNIEGDSGDNIIFGTGGKDKIDGNGGNDWIDGGAGDDDIKTDDGNDTIFGGTGKDKIDAKGGNNWIDGGAGDDDIKTDDGNDTIFGGSGKDKIDAKGGNNEIDGGAGDDDIKTDDGNDIIFGGDGDDKIDAKDGDNWIDGGAGEDDIKTDDGNDTIFGGSGNDKIDAKGGRNYVDGGEGDDDIKGGKNNDTILGGDGDDKIDAKDGDDLVDAGAGEDDVKAGKGDDTVAGGLDDDELDGGSGFDTALYAGSVLDFTWTPTGGNKFEVTDINPGDGDEGTDEIKKFEALQFNDFTVFIDGTNNAPFVAVEAQETDEDTVLAFGVNAYEFDGDPLTLDSISITGGGALTPDGTSVLTPAMGIGAQYSFIFDPGNLYQYLADGEEAVETLTIAVSDDQGGTTTTTADVTITGVNDVVTIGIADLDGAVTEDASAPDLSDSGTIDFGDVDLTDTHIASAGFVSTDHGGGQLGALSASVTTDTTGSGTGGVVTWDFSVANADVQFLGVGETITETHLVSIDDQNGSVVTQEVEVVITGVNDGVSIGVADLAGAVTEDASDPTLTDSGTIDFGDVDLTDAHIITSGFVSTDHGGGQLGAFNAVLTTDTTGSGTGGVATWDFSVANADVQFLGVGETITETHLVSIDDQNGSVVTQEVEVVITGVNDGVSIGVADLAGAVTEDASDPTLTDSGTINFGDVDLTDAHIVSSGFVSTDHGGGQLGAFNVVLTTDTTGFGTGGVATWDFSVANADVQFLGAGETITEIHSVTIDDQNGSVVTQEVEVVITGVNDAPVATDDTYSGPEDIQITGNVLLDDTGNGVDSDIEGDALSVVAGTYTTAQGGTVVLAADGSFTYTPAANYNGPDSFDYTLSDGDLTDTGTVNFTLTPVNDAPVAQEGVSIIANEAAGPVTIDLLDYVDDPDLSDVLVFFNVSIGSRGQVPFTRNGSEVSFDPANLGLGEGQNLVTAITFNVSDQNGGFESGEIGLTINGADDPVPGENTPPNASAVPVSADEGDGLIRIPLSSLIFDPDIGDILTIVSVSRPLDPTVTFSATPYIGEGGFLTIDPVQFGLEEGEDDQFLLTYVVRDSSGAEATSVITLNLIGDTPGVGNTAPNASSIPSIGGEIQDIVVDDPGTTTLTINLFALVSDAETLDEELIITPLGLVIGEGEGGGAVTVPFTFDAETGKVTITLADFGLADGQSIVGTLKYEVSDGEFTASGAVTYNFVNEAPETPVEQTLTFDETFTGEGGTPVPVFENSEGSAVNIVSFKGLSFGGNARVIETDELETDAGRDPVGIVNGQTTFGGQNVLLATTLTQTLPVLDEEGEQVFDPITREPLTETVVTPFGMYGDGFGIGIGDDPILLLNDTSAGLSDEFILSTRPELTTNYDLESLSLNIANGAGNITMTTYRVDVVETPDTVGSDYTAELVIADTFVFASDATTVGESIDFNNFVANPNFETAVGSGISKLDDIYAVTFSTDDGTGVVLDDILVLI